VSKRCITLLVLCCLVITNFSANPKWVTGYYVGYLASVQPVQSINWNGLTHIALGVILPNADGSLNFNSALDTVGRAHNCKVIAMIGGEATGTQWLLAASDQNRANFISQLTHLIVNEGFDGIDLDWEPIEKDQQPVLVKLVKALRANLPKAILTIPIETLDNSNFLPPDRSYIAEIAPYVDQINLMTYGMGHTYEGWKTWHSSPLYHEDSATPASIDYVIGNVLKAGIPAAKLGMGIGFFGLCYGQFATEPLKDTVGLSKDGAALLAGDNAMSYVNIISEYAPEATRNWDKIAQVPYLSLSKPSGAKKCTYISYDDEQSIAIKGQYVKDHGLGGVIIWNINEGYFANQTPANPLLEATRRAFID
jgi:chitinase